MVFCKITNLWINTGNEVMHSMHNGIIFIDKNENNHHYEE